MVSVHFNHHAAFAFIEGGTDGITHAMHIIFIKIFHDQTIHQHVSFFGRLPAFRFQQVFDALHFAIIDAGETFLQTGYSVLPAAYGSCVV